MDIEIFKFQIIKEKFTKKISKLEKEHVTTGFHNSKKYKIYNYKLSKDFSKLRLTIDTKSDFILIKELLERLNYNFQVSLEVILDYLNKQKIFLKNF